MITEYATAFEQLNIEREVFDEIIADEGARQEIAECLFFCLEKVPAVEEIASCLMQYMASHSEENKDGGPGSGNFGHQGRPGEIGGSAPGNESRAVVHGKDISQSYKGPADIKSIIKAQGFDGLPKIVKKAEFDKAVKASKFVAQRTYSASSQEILDAYQDQLYNGDWYVECTTGGAQYGRGMYCAADYNGELSDGIKKEIDHYKEIYDGKLTRSEALAVAKQKLEQAVSMRAKNDLVDKFHKYVDGFDFAEGKWKPEFMDEAKALKESNPDLYDKLRSSLRAKEDWFDSQLHEAKFMDAEELGSKFHFSIKVDTPERVETLTLDPSAKIITYDDLTKRFSEYQADHSYEGSKSAAVKEIVAQCADTTRERADLITMFNLYNSATTQKQIDKLEKLQEKYPDINMIDVNAAVYDKISEMRKSVITDAGAYAAALGYDAINAENHGKSGSYTVILNRSKVLFLDDRANEDSADDGGAITFQLGPDGVIYAIRDRKVIGTVNVYTINKPVEERKDGSGRKASPMNSSELRSAFLDLSCRLDGGPGSGNHGHAGVPGQVGGSAPTSVDSSNLNPRISGAKIEKDAVDKIAALCCADRLGAGKDDSFRIRSYDDGRAYAALRTGKGEIELYLKPDIGELYLDGLYVNKSGQGIGTELVSDIVARARSNGFDRITAYGAGAKNSSANGYYTLPRLGFDGELDPETERKASESGLIATKVSDLVSTPEGRKWWRENGHGIELEFDLGEGSKSSNMLKSYISEHDRSDGGPGSGNWGHEGREGKVGGSAPSDGAKEVGRGEPRSSPALEKAHWKEGFPKVTVHTNLQTLRHSDPELHNRAKHGDVHAADEIISKCVKPERIQELARKYPDAKVVPVLNEDTDEGNQIPLAFAGCFEDYGLEVDTEIIQTKKAGHTDADQFCRLASRPQFGGKVEPGQKYILVDDHITNGGTINDLRKFIESKGGEVVAVSTLSASKGGTFIAIQKKTVDAVYEKHGKGIDDLLRKAGISYDVASLTDREGRYILSMNPETLKRRIEDAKG